MNMKLIIFTCFVVVSHAALMEPIMGGQDAIPHAYPSLVSILVCMDKISRCSHLCSAMIYSRFWVITAAHCVLEIGGKFPLDKVLAVAGKWDMSIREPHQQASDVTCILKHEKYVPTNKTLGYDISLVGLKAGFKFDRWVHSSLLSEAVENDVTVKTMIVGWGALNSEDEVRDIYPNILQVLEVEILSFDECASNMIRLEDSYIKSIRVNLLKGFTMCTGPVTGGKSGCGGDSGGPLYQYVDSKELKIVGILTNSPNPCGSQYGVTIYTKISEFIEWIEETIQNRPGSSSC